IVTFAVCTTLLFTICTVELVVSRNAVSGTSRPLVLGRRAVPETAIPGRSMKLAFATSTLATRLVEPGLIALRMLSTVPVKRLPGRLDDKIVAVDPLRSPTICEADPF